MKQKTPGWCSLQTWLTLYCLQQKDPWCPPGSGVQPSKLPGNIKHKTVQVLKLLSEASWGQSQAPTKLLEQLFTRSSRVSSLPFSPTSRALNSQTSGCSLRWHWDTQAGVPHHCDIKTRSFPPVFPCSSSLSPPCKACLHLPPSSCCSRNSQTAQPESENAMPTLLSVLSQLSPCTFLWGTVLSHTHFLHQTCAGTDLHSWNSLQNPYQGFPSPLTTLTHTQP